MTNVRYLILNRPLSNEAALWIRNDWETYTGPVQITNEEDAAACYLYVQMYGDGDEYSKIEMLQLSVRKNNSGAFHLTENRGYFCRQQFSGRD